LIVYPAPACYCLIKEATSFRYILANHKEDK